MNGVGLWPGKKEGFDGKEWASPDGTMEQRKVGMGLRPDPWGRHPGSWLFRVARQCCPLFSYAPNCQIMATMIK
ncbi:MAG: hypothetical protein IJ418_16900 [Clostridia bacterium]|nr:hypothetical protein [Clostridia bacterium]